MPLKSSERCLPGCSDGSTSTSEHQNRPKSLRVALRRPFGLSCGLAGHLGADDRQHRHTSTFSGLTGAQHVNMCPTFSGPRPNTRHPHLPRHGSTPSEILSTIAAAHAEYTRTHRAHTHLLLHWTTTAHHRNNKAKALPHTATHDGTSTAHSKTHTERWAPLLEFSTLNTHCHTHTPTHTHAREAYSSSQ